MISAIMIWYVIIALVWLVVDAHVIARAAFLESDWWAASVFAVWVLASLFWPLDLIYRIYRKVSRT